VGASRVGVKSNFGEDLPSRESPRVPRRADFFVRAENFMEMRRTPALSISHFANLVSVSISRLFLFAAAVSCAL
jgi:hypothetical protein